MRRSGTLAVVVTLCLAPAVAQQPEAAPGLVLSSFSIPVALDRFGGKQELVPIHHSEIEVNNHKAANVAGSLAGSFFYKPKLTTELAGEHARTVLHDPGTALFVRVMDDPDDDPAHPPSCNWAVVRASVEKDKRVFARVEFTQLTGNAKRTQGVIETKVERLPGGWLKLIPTAPLAPGEYALEPIPKGANAFASVVFDFSLDPAGPNAKDAVLENRGTDGLIVVQP